MPNIINSIDGNTFYNYRTPLIKGEPSRLLQNSTNWRSFFTVAYGAIGGNWNTAWVGYNRNEGGEGYSIRFPAPGIERKISTSRVTISPWLGNFGYTRGAWSNGIKQLDFSPNDSPNLIGEGTYGPYPSLGKACTGELNISSYTAVPIFWVANIYSLCMAFFTDASMSTLGGFLYVGWLREPSYISQTNYVRGFTYLNSAGVLDNAEKAFRISTENVKTVNALSTANNSITNPDILCTTAAAAGADATDIIIRDIAVPNNVIGKLYNCVSLPNSVQVGQVLSNTGIDPDTGAPYTNTNTNKYLVIMPWGGRKLGMRIWTEGYSN